jgi:uroporphyrinogen decarboxylase
MTSFERIQSALNGKTLDRVPICGWRHFPLTDIDAENFIRTTISFTDYCRWDIVKIMSNPHYISDIFGAEIVFSKKSDLWKGEYKRYPVRNVNDINTLRVQDISNPVIRREIDIARGVAAQFKNKVPSVTTVFSPLMSFQEMTKCLDPGPTVEFVHNHPKELYRALEIITQTIINLLDAQIEAGVDGVFFATPFVTDILTDSEYDSFCKEYDSRVLEHIKDKTWFNILHVHGNRGLKWNRVLDYPVQAFNWENVVSGIPAEELSSAADVRKLTNKVLITGLDRNNDFQQFDYDGRALKNCFRERLEEFVQQTGDSRIVFAPGCALPLTVDIFAYSLISNAAEEFGPIKSDHD